MATPATTATPATPINPWPLLPQPPLPPLPNYQIYVTTPQEVGIANINLMILYFPQYRQGGK